MKNTREINTPIHDHMSKKQITSHSVSMLTVTLYTLRRHHCITLLAQILYRAWKHMRHFQKLQTYMHASTVKYLCVPCSFLKVLQTDAIICSCVYRVFQVSCSFKYFIYMRSYVRVYCVFQVLFSFQYSKHMGSHDSACT